MKTSIITISNPIHGLRARYAFTYALAAGLIGICVYSIHSPVCYAQQVNDEAQGAQALTRGPVHEAFAGMVTFNPEPGLVVSKAPPEPIEEIPPEQRPTGDNITWIPGYWAWDDERSDFLWVSGTWRALPPGRAWNAGYWGKGDEGYQWTSGYWADAISEETTYLPEPPASVEDGPNTEAPAKDYNWTPGNWMWRQERYAWTPGYWARGRADWDWMPAHYVWTPRGYIFVDGYWDYSVQRRGMLFAPVYMDSGLYSRSGYNYTPSLVLDLALFAEHLFLRPNYHHYYFGDYYDRSYNRDGYYAAYSYASNRQGYDPIFSHQRWEHRDDRNWASSMATNYEYRRDHENARPPRTWDAMRKIDATSADSQRNRIMVATPLDQMARTKDGSARLQKVDKADRRILAKRGQEVQKSREQRRTLETRSADTAALKTGALAQPIRVKHDPSPIVSKPLSRLKKDQTPPAVPRSPKTSETDRQNNDRSDNPTKSNKGNPTLEPRTKSVEPRERNVEPKSGKTDLEPRDKTVEPRERNVEPKSGKSDLEPRAKTVEPRERSIEPRERSIEPKSRKTDPPERRTSGAEKNTGRGQAPSVKSKSSKSDSDAEEKPGKKSKKGRN